MSKITPTTGPDGLPVTDVGPWVEDKHGMLRKYLDFQAFARRQWLNDRRQNGAAYIDLFSGSGMAHVKGRGFVDGSAVMAWKASQEQEAPFSKVLIADIDPVARKACATRLRNLGAPVIELEGPAIDAAKEALTHLSPYGLHMAFLDPFKLGQLSFELLTTLSALPRIDMIAHVSAMDLFRNYRVELRGERSEFDDFAPGWRSRIADKMTDEEGRRAIIEHWKELLKTKGKSAEAGARQVRNSVNRDLYWLMLIGSNDLASKFWKIALDSERPQREMF